MGCVEEHGVCLDLERICALLVFVPNPKNNNLGSTTHFLSFRRRCSCVEKDVMQGILAKKAKKERERKKGRELFDYSIFGLVV
jgi:hypothetical protein